MRFCKCEISTDTFVIVAALCLLARSRATEVIEIAVKPFIDASMNLIVLIADLLRREAFLNRFRLRRCAVLISAAHIEHVATDATAIPARIQRSSLRNRNACHIPRVHISAQHTADDCAQMRHVVHIR